VSIGKGIHIEPSQEVVEQVQDYKYLDRELGLVQNGDRTEMKEQIYNFTAGMGIKLLQSVFPEYFAKDPLGLTDRYIEYPFVLSKLPQGKAKILDIGCSGSMFPLLMKSLGHDVYGIDIRSYQGDIKFYQGDICESPFEDNFFDIVTAVSTIEHIGLKGRYGSKEDSSDYSAVTEVYRILKPYGLFLMTVPFGIESKVTKWHRIYDKKDLDTLLTNFTYMYTIVESPEADYSLALIRGMK
jgi:SAM-dependent methyltransferase